MSLKQVCGQECVQEIKVKQDENWKEEYQTAIVQQYIAHLQKENNEMKVENEKLRQQILHLELLSMTRQCSKNDLGLFITGQTDK